MPRHEVLGCGYFALVATARLKDKKTGASLASGVAVRKEIEATAKRRYGIGTVCAALDRLEKAGFIESDISDRDGRRPKRFYSLTSQGHAALLEAREESNAIWHQLRLDALPVN
jgi:DNA-binding PadR family transcriptional regulator